MSRGKPLTADLVVSKTKSDSLHNIKNLNLWGNDLQDLKLLREMTNLEVVSLSVNRINSLKEFGNLKKLQELYLRKNNIQDLNEIKYLMKLPELKVLWLHDNPCANSQNYRTVVIKSLPNLVKLDNTVITPEEKNSALNSAFPVDSTTSYNEYEQTPKAKNVDSPHKQAQFQNRESDPRYKQPDQVKYRRDPDIRPIGGAYKEDNRPIGGGYKQESRPVGAGYQENRPSTGNGYRQQSRPSVNNANDRPLTGVAYKDIDNRPLNNARSQVGNPAVKKWQKEQPKKQFPRQFTKQSAYTSEPNSNEAYEAMQRNKNILMAIISLMRELDDNSLEVVRDQVARLTSRR